MLKISVIDDDKASRALLKKYISQTNGVHVHCEHDSARAALKNSSTSNADLIIIDCEMLELSDIEHIEQTDLNRKIIMTSVNKENAINAFDHNFIDFLFKPLKYGRFIKSVERAKNRRSNETAFKQDYNQIFIKNKNGYRRIDLNDILYVEAYADYMNIHTPTERFMALSTMKAIEEKLPSRKFIRVHRSFLVQIDKIDRLEENMISIGEKVIPVSRSCKENLFNRLNFI